jgi:nicotinate phosphoribosyltransferase
MSALNTDLYQLTMAAGYFAAGKTHEIATFELMVRRLPEQRNFLVAAGLRQAVEYLLDFHFEADELDYLRSLKQFKNAPPGFFEFLRDLRFTGDLFAMAEGTPVFASEPLVIVRAPLVEAQIVETYLLSTFAFQTSVASKAARCVSAAEGRSIVEFGSRRAHSPAASVLAARAAYIGGCDGTSNTEAGMRFGIPVAGTAAHSWVMAFAEEEEAFRTLQDLLGDFTVFLIDTYDTLEGARIAAKLGRPLRGVRLDSGDLESLSRQVREILDQAGLPEAKIMATSDLDEHRIAQLLKAGAPVDAFGVGTQLATSADAPALSAVYKLVELRNGDSVQYTAKFSGQKSTMPAAKQVFRSAQCDTLSISEECNSEIPGAPLVRPVMFNGALVEALPSLKASRDHAAAAIAGLPPRLHSIDETVPYEVVISPRLLQMAEEIRREHTI